MTLATRLVAHGYVSKPLTSVPRVNFLTI